MTEGDREFWTKAWEEGRTAFHEGAPNELLVKHVAELGPAKGSGKRRVLVPLAGKAVDLAWLAEQGSEVLGIELHRGAVRAFFDERQIEPTVVKMGRHDALTAQGVTLLCADVFDVGPEDIGTFDVVYDRAALVALDPSDRKRYVALCRRLLREGGRTLLVTLAYDQTKAPGPPWCVDEAAVRDLYGPSPPSQTARIDLLESHSVPTSKRLSEAGLPAFEESIYRIQR